MQLSPEDIHEFQMLCKSDLHLEVSDEMAEEAATNMLQFLQTIFNANANDSSRKT
jgi:hypothetical protein